jgi:hypothetical protein
MRRHIKTGFTLTMRKKIFFVANQLVDLLKALGSYLLSF